MNYLKITTCQHKAVPDEIDESSVSYGCSELSDGQRRRIRDARKELAEAKEIKAIGIDDRNVTSWVWTFDGEDEAEYKALRPRVEAFARTLTQEYGLRVTLSAWTPVRWENLRVVGENGVRAEEEAA